MLKQLLFLGILFFSGWNSGLAQAPAWFYRAGGSLGLHHASFVPVYNDKDNKAPVYQPRLGGQIAAFALHQLTGPLDLETAFFHSIGGMAFGNNPHPAFLGDVSTVQTTGFSFLLYYHVSSKIHLALGTTHALITANNLPYSYNEIDFGIKGACGVYVTPKCRLAVYYAHNFALHPVEAPPVGDYNFYRNALAGLSVAVEFHQKKNYSAAPKFIHPCPRF